jgi:organic hydroperoxide reductase OsmC/OhrA
MQPFPHSYRVTVEAFEGDVVALRSPGLPMISSAPPEQFDGPGNCWSPETLLAASVGDCFVLTFRAVGVARLKWNAIDCEVTGTLDRIDKRTQFTHFEIRAHLRVPTETDIGQARRALERAEHNCLISNSLNATIHLSAKVSVAARDENIEPGVRLSA